MIELINLSKEYDEIKAVHGLNLHIQKGEFFALLGPNGAGKTTTIGMLSTLLLPTEGEICIDGEPLSRSAAAVKAKTAVVTQEFSLRQDMNMDEIMEYQGRLYHMPVKQIREETERLLSFAELTQHRKKTMRKLSGGMKRKLMVCRALLTKPQILLLDEPTAGMDAIARHQMWDLLTKLNRQGLTILLTTHYMEEAEKLCGRVAFMEKGEITLLGTPKEMILDLGEFTVEEKGENGLSRWHFSTKEEALSYIERSQDRCMLRDTVLEDVFLAHCAKE